MRGRNTEALSEQASFEEEHADILQEMDVIRLWITGNKDRRRLIHLAKRTGSNV